MQFYAALKLAVSDDTGFANTVLHIHGGLAILILARVMTRRSLGSMIPFAAVVAFEVLNEIIDRLNHGAWRWSDTTSDLINTLLWPLVISMGVMLRPLPDSQSNAKVAATPAEEERS
jgi:hypothetical protein